MIRGKDNFPDRARPRRLAWRPMALAGFVTLTCIGADINDVMFVNRVSVPVRSGKYAFDKVLATALQGDPLTITRVDGKWLKVRFAPRSADPTRTPATVEGYVMEEALSARAVAAATTRETGNAAEVGATGAGRGLLDAGKYAAAKGLNPDPFYKMVTDSRTAMKGADAMFEQFCKEAKLDAYKPGPTTGPLVTAPTTVPVPRIPTTAPLVTAPTTVPVPRIPTTAPLVTAPTTVPVPRIPTTAPQLVPATQPK